MSVGKSDEFKSPVRKKLCAQCTLCLLPCNFFHVRFISKELIFQGKMKYISFSH